MSNQQINELTYGSIKRLALYLSLPPHYSIARPSQEWFREQEARLRELPSVWLRPTSDSLNMVGLMTRGLMKVSAKQSLPFVPDAAVLCAAHKSLNPWRIRALFALLVSEVTDKFERMRRSVRNNSDLADGPSFQELVRRVTSIQALWMDRDLFEQLYGYPPVMMEKVESQCEACICAVVGGDTRLLVDLRAHLLSRADQAMPVLLKVVDAWINAFEQMADDLKGESALLAEELRRIRHEIGIRRHQRREAYRQAGKSVPYSKAKHDDDSNVPLAPKGSWASRSVEAASTSSDTVASSRFGQHVPSTSHQRPPPSSSRMPETPSSVHANPFGDEHEDHADDGGDDANVGNPAWTEQMNGFYERQAARSSGRGFDSASVHPAFRRPRAPSTTQVSETRTSGRDAPQTPQRTPSTPRDAPRREPTRSQGQRRRTTEPRPEPTSSSRDQPTESETASSRPSSSRPSSRPRTSTGTTRRKELSRLSAVRIETLGGDLRPQPAPPTAASSSSIPPSMAHRESRARSQLQELAAPSSSSSSRPASSANHHRSDTTTSRTNRPSSRAGDAVSSPPSRPANNPVTQASAAGAAAAANSRPSTASAANRTRPQEDVNETAGTAREDWPKRFAALSLNDSGRREGSGNGPGRSSSSRTAPSTRHDGGRLPSSTTEQEHTSSSSTSNRSRAAPSTRHNGSRVPSSTREPEHSRSSGGGGGGSSSSSSSRAPSSARQTGSRAPSSTKEPEHTSSSRSSSSRAAPSAASSVSQHSTAGRSRRASTSSWTSSVYSEEEAKLQPVQSDLYRGVVDLMRGGRHVYDDDATTVSSGSTRR